VRYLMIDFNKAFDVVRHIVLGAKLAQLKLPPSVLQWIISLLNGRTQQVKHASSFSFFKPINMGIVQSSGLGPTLYTVMSSDLKPLSVINILFKFADDTTFLVPENTDINISVEFEHFCCWAKYNHIIISLLKTKEIVFCRLSARS